MKFNFKKITSVLASAVMLGSTIGIAAAASYPSPFVAGGAADVAVVVGANAASSDYLAAIDLGQDLQAELAKQTATTTSTSGTISGEAAALFTSSSKVYVNDTMNAVKNVVTKTEMPVLLKDGSFSGNVDASYTQVVNIGSNPQLTYAKQPTTSEDPLFAFATSTTAGNYIYNSSVTFNKAVAINHTDSENQDLTLFGKKFTIGAATDATNLVLLKSAERLNFDSSGTTSEEVTIEGKAYTVEMVSASTTAATIKVTNEAGASEQKEINEGYSKKVNGITIAINTADSNNLKYTASLVAGAEKITLSNGNAITYGEDDTVIDGTKVEFTGDLGALTKLVVSVYAPTSDKDSINPGTAFVDPVFGTFKVDFSGLNIADDSATREDIVIRASGDDKLQLTMIEYNSGVEKTIQYVYNKTAAALQWDTDNHNIIVGEANAANRSDYIVVGNEDEGHLIKVSQITNQTTGYSQDKVSFTDVFSGDTYTTTLTADGTGTVTIGGKVFNVAYFGASSLTEDARTVRLNYPDSAAGDMIIYPTIQTSKGAKIAFYKPLTINTTDFDGEEDDTSGAGASEDALSNIKVPSGADTYQSLAVTQAGCAGFNITVGGICIIGSANVSITNTKFNYNFTQANNGTVLNVYLLNPDGSGNIVDPALMIFYEKDDNNQYQGLVVTTEPGQSGDDGIGVNDVVRTWGIDAQWDSISLASDSKKTKEADLWGSIILVDSSDSDQKTATISYPDDQVYGQVYIAEEGASITAGTSGSGSVIKLGSVTVKDIEISSAQAKNLIVVGGSCINTVAAEIIGSGACGADFTTATGVGANQFLVKVVDSPYTTGKVAMLVAGYEAADTVKAVTYVVAEAPATDVGTELKKVTATYADVA